MARTARSTATHAIILEWVKWRRVRLGPQCAIMDFLCVASSWFRSEESQHRLAVEIGDRDVEDVGGRVDGPRMGAVGERGASQDADVAAAGVQDGHDTGFGEDVEASDAGVEGKDVGVLTGGEG